MKQRLSRRPKFNLRDVFKHMDCFDYGTLNSDCFSKVLQDNKTYPPEPELSWLFSRFDRRKDGRVSYQDFVDGLMPKNTMKM